MAHSNPNLPVLVSGGGIGGLAAALALVREGFNVLVLEQAPEIGEIGADLPRLEACCSRVPVAEFLTLACHPVEHMLAIASDRVYTVAVSSA